MRKIIKIFLHHLDEEYSFNVILILWSSFYQTKYLLPFSTFEFALCPLIVYLIGKSQYHNFRRTPFLTLSEKPRPLCLDIISIS